MPDLASFTQSEPLPGDHLVGYRTAAAGGERRFLAASFLPAPIGAGKAALALTADTALADTAAPWQFVTPDADGWELTLPDAPAYGLMVVVNVSDTYSFDVVASDATPLGTIEPGASAWYAMDTEVTP